MVCFFDGDVPIRLRKAAKGEVRPQSGNGSFQLFPLSTPHPLYYQDFLKKKKFSTREMKEKIREELSTLRNTESLDA